MSLTDQEQVILKAIGSGVAEISRVIKAVGYPKATTKKVLVKLSEKGVIALHHHDWPQSLTPAQRKLMVRIGRDYFNAVSMRKRNPQSKSKKALKTTGRALKGLAKGALSAGAQILGAGAEVLNPVDDYGLPVFDRRGDVWPKLKKADKASIQKREKYQRSIVDYARQLYAQGKYTDDQIWLATWNKYGYQGDVKAGVLTLHIDGNAYRVNLAMANPRRRKNKTVIKAKRVVVLNKTAKKAATKRRRNLDHKDSKHQVEVSRHWRAGGASQWQRAHKAGQHDLFAHGIKARNPRKGSRKKLGAARRPTSKGKFTYADWSTALLRAQRKDTASHLKWLGDKEPRAAAIVQARLEQIDAELARRKSPKRNASRAIHPKPSKTRRAGASSKTVNRSGVRAVAKTRKAPIKRASKRAVKKSSRAVKGNPSATQSRAMSGRAIDTLDRLGFKGAVSTDMGHAHVMIKKSPDNLDLLRRHKLVKDAAQDDHYYYLTGVRVLKKILALDPVRNPTRKGMRKGYREARRISKVTRGRYFSFESGQRKAARHEKRQERKSKRNNPSAESIRKTFAGAVNGERDLFFPQGTPAGKLAKLGRLVSITTKAGTIKPVSGTAWLCADTKGKLHIGSTSNAPLFSGPARNFGQVTKLEYEGSKPHLGYKGPIIWFHRTGEENGIRPTLRADGKGGLVFKGGDYRLTERGIEN